MKLRKVFAQRLQSLMEERLNLDTQVKVSEAAGISQSSVGRFLKGTVAPTLDNLESLANAFQVPAATLIQAPEESNVHGLDYQLAGLSSSDRRKVFEYAEMVAASQMKKVSASSYTSIRKLSEGEAKEITREAGRPLRVKKGSDGTKLSTKRKSAG